MVRIRVSSSEPTLLLPRCISDSSSLGYWFLVSARLSLSSRTSSPTVLHAVGPFGSMICKVSLCSSATRPIEVSDFQGSTTYTGAAASGHRGSGYCVRPRLDYWVCHASERGRMMGVVVPCRLSLLLHLETRNNTK